jgi:hypothetical protein
MRSFMTAVGVAVAIAGFGGEASAQERPSPSLDVGGGWAGFIDDSMIDHAVVSGALRVHLTPRISVGPEITYMIGPDEDRDLFITGNLTFDFIRVERQMPLVRPYVVVGGGYMQHRNRFGDAFVAHEGAFTAGGGIRVRISDRLSVAPEARLGWEPHVRLGATVSFNLGPR